MTRKDSEAAELTFDVPDTAAGARLDKWLAENVTAISRSRLKTLIEASAVMVAGNAVTDPAYRVKPGQSIVVRLPAALDATPLPQAMDLDIAYEDDHVIVINKPAGLVVHPAPGNPDRTLVNALLAHCGDSLAGIGGVRRPGIVHRLDKDTSGLIIAAKHDQAHAGLAKQFATRTLSRTYWALVWGTPTPAHGEITGNIGRSRSDRKKMAVLKTAGRPALTRYKVLRRFLGGQVSLVECTLATGRTHQIRVHMAHKGHPLLGDQSYGRRRVPSGNLPPHLATALADFKRQALHACRLGFVHPVSGASLKFNTPLPQDFKSLIESLEAV